MFAVYLKMSTGRPIRKRKQTALGMEYSSSLSKKRGQRRAVQHVSEQAEEAGAEEDEHIDVVTAATVVQHVGEQAEEAGAEEDEHIDIVTAATVVQHVGEQADEAGAEEDEHIDVVTESDSSSIDDSVNDSDFVPNSVSESETDEEIQPLPKHICSPIGPQTSAYEVSMEIPFVSPVDAPPEIPNTVGEDEHIDVVTESDSSSIDDSVNDSDFVPNSVSESESETDEEIIPLTKHICSPIGPQTSADEVSMEIPFVSPVDAPPEIPNTVGENVLAYDSTSINVLASDSVPSVPRGSDRPSRPCPFCGKFKVRLTRHIRAVHKTEEQVKQIKKSAGKQRAAFKLLKRRGIMDHNLKIAGQKGAKLLRERLSKSNSSTVVCDTCCGVFNRHWFSSHKQNCQAHGGCEPRPVTASVFFSSCDASEEFKKEILSKFINDEVGKLCQQDETIVMIGSKLFRKLKSRKDKKVEVRRSVMTDMRRLGHVFTHFRGVLEQRNQATTSSTTAVPDMFKQEYLDILEEACVNYTSSEDTDGNDKSGLQIAVYYLLTKAAKMMKVFYLVRRNKTQANETAEFLDVLRDSKDTFIGGAIYNTNKNRNTQLRRVDNLPQIEDVGKLRNYMTAKITEMTGSEYVYWTSSEFVELRDLACARITLFNARRGGEPARLKVSHWLDACNQVWFNKNRIAAMPEEEQEYFNNARIMYQTGKGVNHLVPVIVPEDTIPAITKLADPAFREQCGVSKDNSCLFPSTVSSESSVSGWHALSRACTAAGIEPRKVTATKMRHYASTVYASLEIPQGKRSAFYAHMGHSRTVNESIYQVPLAEQEVREVGSVLRHFGKFCVCFQVHTVPTGYM